MAKLGWAFSSSFFAFQNPGYYDLEARDLAIWHVPNNTPLKKWSTAAFLKYYTDTGFLVEEGGNLLRLYQVRTAPLVNDGAVLATSEPCSQTF